MTYKVNNTCVDVEFLVQGPIQNNVYIVSDGQSTFVVDPSYDAGEIVAALGEHKLDAILVTHGHNDHIGAAAALRKATGAPIICSSLDAHLLEAPDSLGITPPADPCPADRTVSDGDVIELGTMKWRVLMTPGHTKGSMCLYLDAAQMGKPELGNLLLSGDTLFAGSTGRTDFPGGSDADMRQSLAKLAKLPDNTLVCPGHNNLTTIAQERRFTFARWGVL